LIEIGDRVVISDHVILLTHDYSYTTGLIAIGESPKQDISINGKIVIHNNVFIGMNSLILPGTCIYDNVIIGAGSIVKGIINANSIYAGNPAKKIADIGEYVNKVQAKKNIKLFTDKK
jgi:acetyltransferase-like isoleucine patch superfamily enzyme